ncbi:hypothetical protein CPT_Madawaska_206 [Staphylococcus phage Madawaska]|nr:hypothetical protein CPT_Madawaska_206 [Staphylococcus phage Madawaska]
MNTYDLNLCISKIIFPKLFSYLIISPSSGNLFIKFPAEGI